MTAAKRSRPRAKKAGRSPGPQPERRPRRNPHTDFSAGAKVLDENGLIELVEKLQEPPFLLILDLITDPHNLGACLRSADAAGVHAVIAPRDRAAGITDTVRQVASGAAESIPFAQVTNLARVMDQLKQRGVWFVGTTHETDQTIYDIDLTGPITIVMGSEGQGLRRLTQEKCDFLAGIPMNGKVENLNVSVATGVCLFEAVRQRGLKKRG